MSSFAQGSSSGASSGGVEGASSGDASSSSGGAGGSGGSDAGAMPFGADVKNAVGHNSAAKNASGTSG